MSASFPTCYVDKDDEHEIQTIGIELLIFHDHFKRQSELDAEDIDWG